VKVTALFCALALAIVLGDSARSAEAIPAVTKSYLLPSWWGPALKNLPYERVAERDTRIRVVDGHPCGDMVMAQVGRVPRADDAILGTDPVAEIDANGRVINSWRVPIDGIPYAVDGSQIMMWVHRKIYWFGLDRRIKTAMEPEPIPPSGPDCPKNESGLKGEIMCTTLKDRTSGKDRVFVSFLVCT
jgi:hypothetical protein